MSLAQHRHAVEGVAPGQHRLQLVGADLALEAEVLRSVADPFPGRLSLAGVVVLGALARIHRFTFTG